MSFFLYNFELALNTNIHIYTNYKFPLLRNRVGMTAIYKYSSTVALYKHQIVSNFLKLLFKKNKTKTEYPEFSALKKFHIYRAGLVK